MATHPDPDDVEPSPPSLPYTSERRDASVIEQWDDPSRTYRCYEAGVLVEERPYTAPENAEADARVVETGRRINRAELLRRARQAHATNASYLAAVTGGTATNAQHIAQTAALTRQMQGLIRLLVGSDLLDQLDATT